MNTNLHRCHSDVCQQGRTHCPTPFACEVPDEEPGIVSVSIAIGWMLLWVATIAFACGGAALFAMWLMEWAEPYWPRFVAMASF